MEEPEEYSPEVSQLMKSADHSDVESMVKLRHMFLFEPSVKRNCKKGKKYLKAAADQGNGEAFYELGFMYQMGCGCEIDIEK